METPISIWAGFFAIVLLLLAFDLGLLHRKEREIGVRESLWLSLGYVCVSLCFGFAVFHFMNPQDGRDFFTGYVIEKSLSMDNIFVISLVFNYFYIPRRYQQRVLFWGVIGAIVLRGFLIGLGSVLIQQFHAILYGFGAFLVITGVKMLFAAQKEEAGLENNKLLRWLRRHIPVSAALHENKFFVRESDPLVPARIVSKATPLFLTLIFIELADVVFAVDSVPAVFAVTTDPFIVYTSNIFAALGLRALYFALSAMLHRFAYLKYALSLVLIFIGSKIFLTLFIGHIPSSVSLSVTLALLAGGVLVSLYKTRGNKAI